MTIPSYERHVAALQVWTWAVPDGRVFARVYSPRPETLSAEYRLSQVFTNRVGDRKFGDVELPRRAALAGTKVSGRAFPSWLERHVARYRKQDAAMSPVRDDRNTSVVSGYQAYHDAIVAHGVPVPPPDRRCESLRFARGGQWVIVDKGDITFFAMFDGNPMLPSDFNERRDDVLKFVLHIDGIDDPQWVTLDPSGRYTLESGEEISVSSASREEVDVAVSKILRQHVASSLDRLSELSSDSLLRTLDFVQGEELTLERAKSGR